MDKFWNVSVMFGPANTMINFLFKTEERAEESWARGNAIIGEPGIFQIQDDFGQKATFIGDSMHCLLLDDMEASQVANVERSLHNARGQMEVDRAANADPNLRSYIAMQKSRMNGPGRMVHPGPLPGF